MIQSFFAVIALKLNDNGLKRFEVNIAVEDNYKKPIFAAKDNLKNEQLTNGTDTTVNKSYKTQNTMTSYKTILRLHVTQRIHDYCQFMQKDIGVKLQVTTHDDNSDQVLQIQHILANTSSQDVDVTNNITFVSITGLPLSIHLEPNDEISNQKVQNSESEPKYNDHDKEQICASTSKPKKNNKLKIIKQHGIGQNRAFLIDVIIQNKCSQSSKEDGHDGAKTSNGENIVSVTLHCFSQTQQGDIIMERIKSQMEGEIKRSNRRWRRNFSRKNKT